ncbi:MAG TPA: hypothetical protein VGW80_07550 [Solirubrobacterales bacterium]|nr:hypothetical protein [Solirubrobacterales bacterium]
MTGAESSSVVHIDPVSSEAERLWTLALKLAQALGPEREWSLIGGLMVQLHGLEHGDELRPTVDIDLLGAARKPPAMTEEMASLIAEMGGKVATPPRSKPDVGYKFELDGETVEILGPDGLKSDPKTLGKLTTFQASGGTQALQRTEVVLVSLRYSPPIAVRRPSLLGAILIKARVVAKQRKEKFDSDRQDLIRLLSYVEDPRALARDEDLKATERKWLRKVEGLLNFEDAALAALFPRGVIERAQQAFQLLSA